MILTATQLELFRRHLLERQQALQQATAEGEKSAATVELDQTRVGRLSRMDALQGQAMSLAAKRRRKVELQKLSAALQRIDSDEFGACLDCGETIAYARLEAEPATVLCIVCAERRENR